MPGKTSWRAFCCALGFAVLRSAESEAAVAAHQDLTWNGPRTCLECHEQEARQVYNSTHYQWKGLASYMTHGPAIQGKAARAVNSYCINILGNWNACGNCHVGLGAEIGAVTGSDPYENIDCLICHQSEYKRKREGDALVPDTAAMSITMDEAARTVHMPTRATCLQCHANSGGGDAVKRGDLAMAHVATSDSQFDAHMATTGQNLLCQDCHDFTDHRVVGKGSDLRSSDRNEILECMKCHQNKAVDHGGSVGRHVQRVACQTCHIPTYARNATDTAASEATETHRTWRDTAGSTPPIHPASTKANDLTPKYRWWNRYSDNYLLGDPARRNRATNRYYTSMPLGSILDIDAKIYPFKYKTAEQPIQPQTQQLIALDTSVFFATGDADAATQQGLENMGFDRSADYSWIETETWQLLNHEVAQSTGALSCDDCHGVSARIDLMADFGYKLKESQSMLCVQCHGPKGSPAFQTVHNIHVKNEGYDCNQCHLFTRDREENSASDWIQFQ